MINENNGASEGYKNNNESQSQTNFDRRGSLRLNSDFKPMNMNKSKIQKYGGEKNEFIKLKTLEGGKKKEKEKVEDKEDLLGEEVILFLLNCCIKFFKEKKETYLSQRLSNLTTKKVILLVMIIIMFLPLFSYDTYESDYTSYQAGLTYLYKLFNKKIIIIIKIVKKKMLN